MLKNKDKDKLFFSCGKHGNMLYANLFMGAALMCMNLESGEFELFEGLYGPDKTNWWGRTDFLFVKDKLYQVANRMDQIVEYDFIDDKCNYWPIDEPCHTFSCPNYSLSILQENYIYIFPKFDGVIRIFDINKHEIVTHRALKLDSSYICEENIGEKGALISRSMQIADDVWMFSRQNNLAWKYSLVSHEVEKYSLSGNYSGCVDATWHEGRFYLLDEDGRAFAWDGKQDYAEEIFSTGKGDNCFIRVAVTDKHIWLLPCFGDDIYRYDTAKALLESYRGMPKDFAYTPLHNPQAKYYKGCEDEEHYYFAMCASTHMLIINKRTGEVGWLRPEYASKEDRAKHLRLVYGDKELSREDVEYGLEEFLIILRNSHQNEAGTRSQYGMDIYKYIIGGAGH